MNNNLYSLTKIKRRRTRRKFIARLVIFTLVLVSIIAIFFTYNKLTRPTSPVSVSKPPTTAPAFTAAPALIQNKSLKAVVEASLEGTQGSYSVIIKNLKTSDNYVQAGHEVFEAGSLYKLWVMAAVYQQIEKGQLKESQILSQSIPTLNKKFSIDPDLAEQTTGVISLTVDQALHQMITISHNYAALLLTEKIRLSTVDLFLKQNKFLESTVGTQKDAPMTTTSDVALFLEKLYKGELVSQDASQKMLELLKKQTLNDKLPKNLPTETIIAHKTGEIGWFSHDAGIVFSDKGDYIIVVLSESDSPKGAEERIAQLSKDVYDYIVK